MNPTFLVPSENLSFRLLPKEDNDRIERILEGLMKNIQDTCVNIRSIYLGIYKVNMICPSENPNNFKVHSTDDNPLVKGASKCPPE